MLFDAQPHRPQAPASSCTSPVEASVRGFHESTSRNIPSGDHRRTKCSPGDHVAKYIEPESVTRLWKCHDTVRVLLPSVLSTSMTSGWSGRCSRQYVEQVWACSRISSSSASPVSVSVYVHGLPSGWSGSGEITSSPRRWRSQVLS
ncbi:hypothetical protein ACIA78_21810 [Streptomyces xanthochromogenes]|uniref:hypothetical protein n=1 Tax=Streptomyces xanthochromogenes TaxID=67384 RepID=UPI00378DE3F3